MSFGSPPVEMPVEEEYRAPTLPGGVLEASVGAIPVWGIALQPTLQAGGPFLEGDLALALGLSDRVQLSVRADGLSWWHLALEEGPDLGLAVTVHDGPRWDFAPALIVPIRTVSGPPFGDLPAPGGATVGLDTRLLPGDGVVFVDLGHRLVEVVTLIDGLDTPPGEYDWFFTVGGAVGVQVREQVAIVVDATVGRIESYGDLRAGRSWSVGRLPLGVAVQITPRPTPWGDLVVRFATDDWKDTTYLAQRLEIIGRVRTSFRRRS